MTFIARMILDASELSFSSARLKTAASVSITMQPMRTPYCSNIRCFMRFNLRMNALTSSALVKSGNVSVHAIGSGVWMLLAFLAVVMRGWSVCAPSPAMMITPTFSLTRLPKKGWPVDSETAMSTATKVLPAPDWPPMNAIPFLGAKPLIMDGGSENGLSESNSKPSSGFFFKGSSLDCSSSGCSNQLPVTKNGLLPPCIMPDRMVACILRRPSSVPRPEVSAA